MKEEKRPYSVTPQPAIPELSELERIKAKMLSDVAIALIGCCDVYPSPLVIARDTKRIVELCFSEERMCCNEKRPDIAAVEGEEEVEK